MRAKDRAVVAIDGPSGVGKSTIASRLAQRLGLPFLETGAMYRALAWKTLEGGVDPHDRPSVESLAKNLDLELREYPDGRVEVRLDKQPLDSGIRAPMISEITSVISSYSGVRREMVERQRDFAQHRGAVMEGRDIGTRVFPDTQFKFFLTAPLEVRVDRRLQQLRVAGETQLSREAIEDEVEGRDLRDSRRADSPLTMDGSYTVIDTGELSVEEAVDLIARVVEHTRVGNT